eukprot:tig00000448_g838.t1
MELSASASTSRCETPTALESDSDCRSLHNKPSTSPLARLFKALNVVANDVSASPPASPRAEPSVVDEPSAGSAVNVDCTLRRPGSPGAPALLPRPTRRRKSLGLGDAQLQAPASTGELRVTLAKRNMQRRSSIPSAFMPPDSPETADPIASASCVLRAKRAAEAEAVPLPFALPCLEVPLRNPNTRDAKTLYWTSAPECYAYSAYYSQHSIKRRLSLPGSPADSARSC